MVMNFSHCCHDKKKKWEAKKFMDFWKAEIGKIMKPTEDFGEDLCSLQNTVLSHY